MINFVRIRKYLQQISDEIAIINSSLKEEDKNIIDSKYHLRSLKYSMVVIAEAIANTLQHLLAKKFNVSVSGYKEVFIKARANHIISDDLYSKLYPFIQFRNMLIHQYWEVDDELFLKNLRAGIGDFEVFIKTVDSILDSLDTEDSQ